MSVTAADPELTREQPPGEEARSGLGRLLRDPGRVWGYVGIPIVVLGSWLATYRWVSGLELDRIEQRWLNTERVTRSIIGDRPEDSLRPLAKQRTRLVR